MNPRSRALKVFEEQAIAMRTMADPIVAIEKALWEVRQETLGECAKKCLEIQGPGLDQPIQDYNAG
jgi:hypothetical protein